MFKPKKNINNIFLLKIKFAGRQPNDVSEPKLQITDPQFLRFCKNTINSILGGVPGPTGSRTKLPHTFTKPF